MAIIRPALTNLEQLFEPLDPAALLTARALSALDDSWTISIRARLGLDIIDFVAVHEQYGVCAITTLDWTPRTRQVSADGLLHTVGASGVATPVADNPRFAAHRQRNNIYDRSFALPSDGTEPTSVVRSAVIAPLLTHAEATELLDARHHDESQQHVEVWGGDALDVQLERIVVGVGCTPPRTQSLDRVRRLIAPSERAVERVAPAPRSVNAYEVEVNPDDIAVRRFWGAAGSGKTFGLAARAARLAAQGQRVLVLSFNVTLSDRLSSLVSDRCREYGANPTRVTCTNFHSYCTRIVQDAEIAGYATTAPKGVRWTQAIVAKALNALEAGYDDRYDAVLIDEGQDFTMAWWNLLRSYAVKPDGEMLLMVDPTLDLYERDAWSDEAAMTAAGFEQPWVELAGSYRMPDDLTELVGAFASSRLDGEQLLPTIPTDRDEVVGPMVGTTRQWNTIAHVGDAGVVIGREVVRLLRENPTLEPADVTFLCDYHHDGVAAAREIESAGFDVHHIFSRDPDDARRRRKYRFSPTASAVKGSTIHSFKGWETPALVMGIGMETRSKRVAYAAMTRVVGSADRPAVISVVSADKRLDDFRAEFIAGSVATPTAPPAPAEPARTAPTVAPPDAAQADADMARATPNRPLTEPSQPNVVTGASTEPTQQDHPTGAPVSAASTPPPLPPPPPSSAASASAPAPSATPPPPPPPASTPPPPPVSVVPSPHDTPPAPQRH